MNDNDFFYVKSANKCDEKLQKLAQKKQFFFFKNKKLQKIRLNWKFRV